MLNKRITVVDNFETLIARAGLSKEGLAREAGISRGVLYRAISPASYGSGDGAIRGTTAWKVAKAYARVLSLDDQTAFNTLFTVESTDAAVAEV